MEENPMYTDAKNSFISYFSMFAHRDEPFPMEIQNMMTWICISTWSNFTEKPQLHTILDEFSSLHRWYQELLLKSSEKRNQSDDSKQLFEVLMAKPNVIAAVGDLNVMIQGEMTALTSMSDQAIILQNAHTHYSEIVARLGVAERVYNRVKEHVSFHDDEYAQFKGTYEPMLHELAQAKQQLALVGTKFAHIHPLGAGKQAYVGAFQIFQLELNKSFEFFRSQIGTPSHENDLYVKYCAGFNEFRSRKVTFVESAENYKLLNSRLPIQVPPAAAPSSPASVPSSPVAAQQVPSSPVAAQQVPSSPVAAHSAVSIARPSPASSSPASSRSSSSSSSSDSTLSLGSVEVSSDQVRTPATPTTPLDLGPFSASVSVRPPGGGKKKTRSNHKRSAHKHKRSAHKHKRSAHKHKRSARKHKKL